MSILDEIGYYDGREEGELTPSPSDDDQDPEYVPRNKQRPIGTGSLTIRLNEHRNISYHRRHRRNGIILPSTYVHLDKIKESKVPRSAMEEEELRLRLLVLASFRRS
jgi:hypothetical protein